MKSATIAQLKKELNQRSSDELLAFCLRLAKYKKENKELLSYLLFESDDEVGYIESVQQVVADQLSMMNTKNYYWMRKSIRKVLKEVKKYIRYSQKKETEVELLLDFCMQLKELSPPVSKDRTLQNLLDRELALVRKKIGGLHEDLQFDYNQLLEEVND